MALNSAETIGNLLTILAKLSPDVLSGLASAVAGALTGGVVAIGVTSFTAGPAVALGAGAYALGGGATAVALEGGIAIAIGAGASAATVGGIAVALAPAVAIGLSVGALIGLLSFLVYKFATRKGKQD